MGARNPSQSEAERLDWLRLYRSENVGPATFFRLIEHFGSANRALEALPDLARRGGGKRPIKVAAKSIAESELDALAKLGATLLLATDPDFPVPLRSVETVPFLTIRGNVALLARPTVAIVGARNASSAGRRFA